MGWGNPPLADRKEGDNLAVDEYKALTLVNLPFIGEEGKGKLFRPGEMIPREDLEAYADAALESNKEAHNPSADEVVEHFMQFGSISDNPDADLHPDHRPVAPDAPTMARLIEQARMLKAQMEERGEVVPDELVTLAATDYRHVSTADSGSGGDEA